MKTIKIIIKRVKGVEEVKIEASKDLLIEELLLMSHEFKAWAKKMTST